MGTERVEELPDELESWVTERAAAEGIPRDEFVRRLLAAHRELENETDVPDPGDGADGLPADGSATHATDGTDGRDVAAELESVSDEIDELSDRLETVESDLESRIEDLGDRLDQVAAEAGSGTVSASELDDLAAEVETLADESAELSTRVGALEEDLDTKIQDVRERVIQIKRETDAKAPAEHDHPDIESQLRGGFQNFERILEHLTDLTDEHDAKLDAVAGAIVDLREQVVALERDAAERAAVDELRREANRLGVAEANCDSCGNAVNLGLLDEPFCPHCESPFDGVEAKNGFFGSHRLTVGDRPALEAGGDETPGGDGDELAALGDVFEHDDDDDADESDSPGDYASDSAGTGFSSSASADVDRGAEGVTEE